MVEKSNYGEDQIRVLEGLEAVRLRPEMYIGSREKKGLHHLIWEIVDNSVDEHMAGFCDEIKVIIHKDNSITVKDNGRGIPVGIHSTQKIPTLEVVLTVLHAGGKFGGDSPYKSSGGLHGVGSACVNALSEHMVATVKRDGKIHQIEFSKGKTIKNLSVVGDCESGDTGTSIWFKPDPDIFVETTEYDFKIIYDRLRESAFLNGGLKLKLIDERVDEDSEFRESNFIYENGIKDYIELINKNKKPIVEDIFHYKETKDDVYVEIAFQYTDSFEEIVVSFANNIKTIEGGNHEAGFKAGVTNVINHIVNNQGLVNEGETLTGEDIRTGVSAVISVKVPEPQFEGQTKNKLTNAEVRQIVNSIVRERLEKSFADNPRILKPIVDKVMRSHKERLSLRRARIAIRKENKRDDSTFTLPEKLADCRMTTPFEKRELFIVEGDSAGGSAKSGRAKEFQAILPLRGKVLNVQNSTEDKILANREIDTIRTAVGTGLGEDFNYEDLRYNKIIIMTDADVDGAHIQVLLLTLFYRFMRPLIEKGHIYLAQPPLFGIMKRNKVVEYVRDERDLDDAILRHPNSVVQRYKGLGEMNADQLEETTMSPKNRSLLRITIDDVIAANEIFESLMGDDPEQRRIFIESNSHKADIDI